MKPWYHVVRDARLIYLHRNDFAYLFGANGERPKSYSEAQRLVDMLWNMYPAHFNEYVIAKGRTKSELINSVVNKRCFDCSSFVCAVTQDQGSIYDLQVKNDLNSDMLRRSFSKETGLNEGKWGTVLWKQGHVAIDAGNGLAVDFGAEFVDVREYRFVDPDTPTKFMLSGELPWVDYSNGINF